MMRNLGATGTNINEFQMDYYGLINRNFNNETEDWA